MVAHLRSGRTHEQKVSGDNGNGNGVAFENKTATVVVHHQCVVADFSDDAKFCPVMPVGGQEVAKRSPSMVAWPLVTCP